MERCLVCQTQKTWQMGNPEVATGTFAFVSALLVGFWLQECLEARRAGRNFLHQNMKNLNNQTLHRFFTKRMCLFAQTSFCTNTHFGIILLGNKTMDTFEKRSGCLRYVQIIVPDHVQFKCKSAALSFRTRWERSGLSHHPTGLGSGQAMSALLQQFTSWLSSPLSPSWLSSLSWPSSTSWPSSQVPSRHLPSS